MNIFQSAPSGQADALNVMASIITSSAQVVATGNTINTVGISMARTAPAGAVTGVILQSGTFADQAITVVNESTSANTITFAASGTSNVADGTSDVISGLTCRMFRWDTGTSLWYRVG